MENKEEIFIYLDYLQKTAITNMFGAVPYLQNEFDLTLAEARSILVEWMVTYDERHVKDGICPS